MQPMDTKPPSPCDPCPDGPWTRNPLWRTVGVDCIDLCQLARMDESALVEELRGQVSMEIVDELTADWS